MQMKTCSKCHETKPVSEFSRDRSKKYGLRHQCKACDAVYRADNREKIVKRRAEYYVANRDKIARRMAEHYVDNRDKIAKQQAEYYAANRDKIREKHAYYRVANSDKSTKRHAKYYAANRDKIRKQQAEHYAANSDKSAERHAEYQSEYCANHREERRGYERNRRANDIQYRLACNLRSRLNTAIKNNQKTGSAVRDLGCTTAELKEHLEDQFQPGMSWNNYGEWHIDHIKPLNAFNLENRKELLEACHYTNLQPMWGSENISKGNKILEG